MPATPRRSSKSVVLGKFQNSIWGEVLNVVTLLLIPVIIGVVAVFSSDLVLILSVGFALTSVRLLMYAFDVFRIRIRYTFPAIQRGADRLEEMADLINRHRELFDAADLKRFNGTYQHAMRRVQDAVDSPDEVQVAEALGWVQMAESTSAELFKALIPTIVPGRPTP